MSALVLNTDLGGKWSLNAPLQIRSHISHWKPSIIHVHGSYPSIHGRVAAIGLGVPVIWTVQLHPIWYVEELARFPLFQRAFIGATLRCLNRCTTEVVFVSYGLAKTTNQFVGRPPSKWDVVYNGIDVEKYRPSLKRRQIFRQAIGITNNVPIVGIIARLTPRKGIDTFLHAIKCLRNKEAICIIAGEGPYLEEYKLLSKNLGISKRTQFLGAIPSVENFVAALDVGVLASRSEGFPLSVIEMLSAGVPVVLSDIPMHSEFRIASPAVNFVPVDEPVLLSEKIDAMIEASKSDQVREKARKVALKYFSREAMVSQYQKVYRRHLKD
jgi:glycosyltransferase involved in cell wall biosynthesis